MAALNSTVELMKEIGRPRNDMYEVAVWEDILTVEGREAFYAYQVDNQAVVIPENVDANLLSPGGARGAASIERTNGSPGIRQRFV